jgi:riboflavin kinase/FMN adenylyltransferase
MEKKTIYALGFFDGVHLGHQALLKQCRELADQNGCQAGVVTFTSHPDSLVLGEPPALLNTSDDRARLLYAFGMDIVKEIPFDRELMTTHWSTFLDRLLAVGAAGFVCGDDFRFGSGGLGTAKKLAAYCKKKELPYAIVPEQIMGGERISSTRIRSLLEQGDLENVSRLLGHPHVLTGMVTPGKQLGRTLGFPTANLPFPAELATPKLGVYVCVALVDDQTYVSLCNIGIRPTVAGESINAEIHLLDFDSDLYGKEITIAFHTFLRPEKKFESLEELKAQIAEDIAQVRQKL